MRAELDALPLTEVADCRPYVSLLPGRMHACGHDGHMAMVLIFTIAVGNEFRQGSVPAQLLKLFNIGMS
ncbi:M20/M25/M40 family metallo-hydrolase [Burkholderia sp. Bp9143]|uniref:M20/M25/M40 family metallo-hydrolase n=1 Tax=Burkholderia sp. Bp9143 TaxID=2184574 RepID=UPI0028932E23|nr:M20/M25/M40 family metallo-hydrolase [Burkholderia sp. Bp9143]